MGRPAGEQAVEDRAQRVDVGPAVDAATGGLFGRHVRRRAEHSLGVGARAPDLAGQAEITDLQLAIFQLGRPSLHAVGQVHQDVGRLEVAVNKPLFVHVVHRQGQSFDQVGGERGGQATCAEFAVEPVFQIAAADVLQAQEGPAVELADVVNLNEIAVVEAGDGAGFGVESGQVGGAGVLAGEDHFEGFGPVHLTVTDQVDDAHAAAAQFLQDLEARQLRQVAVRPRGFGRRDGRCRMKPGLHLRHRRCGRRRLAARHSCGVAGQGFRSRLGHGRRVGHWRGNATRGVGLMTRGVGAISW